MPEASLLEEMKKRKVVQWGLAYVAVAWVVAQVVETVAGPWNIPDNMIRNVHMVLIGGVPIAVILSWFHGARGDQRITGGEVAAVTVVLGVVIAAIALLNTAAESPSTAKVADAGGRFSAVSGALPRLAVLAFDNVGSPDDSYFADGITDELNSRLSGLSSLAILSRSSADMYRESTRTVREIGHALGADYVLHGTVRWSPGEQGATAVRITPEIIRVADDTQIWSSRYDREFEDALTIQSEIALEVVAELGVALSDRERTAVQTEPTKNPLAYQAYLKALQTLPDGHGAESDYLKARTLVQQAIAIDPNSASAWALLSQADMGLYWFGYDQTQERLDEARESIDKAIALEPNLAEANIALGDYYYRRRDWNAALAQYSKVYELRPNDSEVGKRMGYIWRRNGLFSEAADSLRRASELNPLNSYDMLEYAWTEICLGNYESAEEQIQLAYETDPTEEWTYLIWAALYWSRGEDGDLERAASMLERFPEPRAQYPAFSKITQDLFEGNPESALRLVRDLAEPVLVLQAAYIPADLAKAQILSAMGRDDEAFSAFQAARDHLEVEYRENPDDFRLSLALGQVYAGLGLRDDALREAITLVELMPVTADSLLGTDALYGQMRIYAMLGEFELALDTMAKLVALPTHFRGAYFTKEPTFAALRNEQRFWDLLEE